MINRTKRRREFCAPAQFERGGDTQSVPERAPSKMHNNRRYALL